MKDVTAGRVSARLGDTDIRYLAVDGYEILRRLYVAVRDINWGTVPGEILSRELTEDAEGWELHVEVRHRRGAIDFLWQGEVTCRQDKLEFAMRGRAASEFQYNRIGICLLHPAEWAGGAFRTEAGEGNLPVLIGAQKVEDGLPVPLFPSFRSLKLERKGLGWAGFELEGDLFEMEDQRNWIDASFKTYSTPFSLGIPHAIAPGEIIDQRVEVTWGVEDGVVASAREMRQVSLPRIGLGASGTGAPELTTDDLELLWTLGPAHLRVDLVLDDSWRLQLQHAADVARGIGAALEVVLFVAEGCDLDAVAQAIARCGAPVARFLVFHAHATSTPPGWVERMRRSLPVGAVVGGGTNLWFTDFNRDRPEPSGWDVAAYAVSPTVHADDDISLIETPSVVADTVKSASVLAPHTAIAVTPITLRPRFNPVATSADLESDAQPLPANVDHRQRLLLGAGWTLAMIVGLADGGASSATFFEPTGWRGVIQGAFEPSAGSGFSGRPGDAYPLFHVLADAVELGEGPIDALPARPPFALAALVANRGDVTHVLVANLGHEPLRHRFDGIGGAVSRRLLDSASAEVAAREPLQFRRAYEEVGLREGLEVDLPAFAYCRYRVVQRSTR